MTTALTNNLNNIGETLKKEFHQIAGINQKNSFGNFQNKITDFQEKLRETEEEIGIENSLDLTLARDIKDIIKDLKEATAKTTEDETAELNPATVFEQILALNDSTTNPTVKEVQLSTQIEKTLAKESVLEEISESSKEILNEEMIEDLNIESIKAEADTPSQGDFMQNESMQEHGIKALINPMEESFEIKSLEQSVKAENTKPSAMTPEKLIEQITKQTEALNKGSRVNIILNPESLGRINIQLLNTKQGLSAEFTVTTNEARELLLKGLDNLKETLTAQGIGVDNVTVKISDTQESEYNPDWTEQEPSENGRNQHRQQKHKKEKEIFEQLISKQIDENGNV